MLLYLTFDGSELARFRFFALQIYKILQNNMLNQKNIYPQTNRNFQTHIGAERAHEIESKWALRLETRDVNFEFPNCVVANKQYLAKVCTNARLAIRQPNARIESTTTVSRHQFRSRSIVVIVTGRRTPRRW